MSETIESITIESEGMTIPLLVWRRFHRPMPLLVERIYSMNRGLARQGAFVPLGRVVKMPIPPPVREEIITPIRLWE